MLIQQQQEYKFQSERNSHSKGGTAIISNILQDRGRYFDHFISSIGPLEIGCNSIMLQLSPVINRAIIYVRQGSL